MFGHVASIAEGSTSVRNANK